MGIIILCHKQAFILLAEISFCCVQHVYEAFLNKGDHENYPIFSEVGFISILKVYLYED